MDAQTSPGGHVLPSPPGRLQAGALARPNLRDVLDDLLSGCGEDDDCGAVLENLIRPASPPRSRGEDIPRLRIVSTPPRPAKARAAVAGFDAEPAAKGVRRKRKTTQYLTDQTFERLIKAKIALSGIVPGSFHFRLSKSAIVEGALAIILAEFERRPMTSRLAKSIVKELRRASEMNGEEPC